MNLRRTRWARRLPRLAATGMIPAGVAAVGTINPALGIPAASLGGLLIGRLNRRGSEFLSSLETMFGPARTWPELLSNDEFCTLVIRAIEVARTTNQEEVFEALRNILRKAAEQPDVDADLRIILVSVLGQMTGSHIQILRNASDPEAPPLNIVRPMLFDPHTDSVVDQGNLRDIQIFHADLIRLGLVETWSEDDYPRTGPIQSNNKPRSRSFRKLSLLGEQLLSYISDPTPMG